MAVATRNGRFIDKIPDKTLIFQAVLSLFPPIPTHPCRETMGNMLIRRDLNNPSHFIQQERKFLKLAIFRMDISPKSFGERKYCY